MNLYQTIARHFSAVTKLFLLTIIVSVSLQAQTSSVDLSFNAVPEKNSIVTLTTNFILQPDTKLSFSVIFNSSTAWSEVESCVSTRMAV